MDMTTLTALATLADLGESALAMADASGFAALSAAFAGSGLWTPEGRSTLALLRCSRPWLRRRQPRRCLLERDQPRRDQPRRDQRGEGVISAAIAVLIIASLGALMWVGFKALWENAEETTNSEISKIGK
ncbi:hypothetical protein [Candidatus Poriferisodalis sp.]|uniref:hypothetical protein n=1 Tax=Candidatus Poriferisodalis sp. TaxID=3101277 RepID=UPI003B02123B